MPLPPASERGDRVLPYNQVSTDELAERLDGHRPMPFNLAASRVPMVTDLILPGRDIHLGRPNADFKPYVTFPNPDATGAIGRHRSVRIDEVIIPEDDRREVSFVEIDPTDSENRTVVRINYQGEVTLFES